MEKRKQLLIAIVVFVGALVGNNWWINSQINEGKEKKFVKVVRAKKSLDPGDLLGAGAIEAVEVPEKFMPKASIRWADRDGFLQQPLATKVINGDYVLETAFGRAESVGRTLSQQLGDDARAITLTVDEMNSFSRSIVTGDKIDILFSFNVPPVKQKITTLLLQNIPVVSTGAYNAASQELGEKGARGGRYNTITLKLSPQDAVRLTYARQAGQINILLRSNVDEKPLDMAPVAGVEGVLSPQDKQLVESLVRQAQQGVQVSGERNEAQLREQARATLEQQKRQLQQLGIDKK